MTAAPAPATLWTDDTPPADAPEEGITLHTLTAAITEIRDAAEHLLTTLSAAVRAAKALTDADDTDTDDDSAIDPSCKRGRHWYTYYRQVGTSAPTCTRPGCDVENPRYNPVHDPHVSVQVTRTA